VAIEIVGQARPADEPLDHVDPGQGGGGRLPGPLPDRPAEFVLQLLAQVLADTADLFDGNHGGPAFLLGSLGAARIEARAGRGAIERLAAMDAEQNRPRGGLLTAPARWNGTPGQRHLDAVGR
jgi:hypothetical protein